MDISQKDLKESFNYDAETGVFTRAKTTGYRGKYKKGTVAGGIQKSSGYVVISIKTKRYYAHRLAWLYVHGVFPERGIDHINQNKSDNRIENLRELDHQGNGRNAKRFCTNTSGATGVTWSKKAGKWQAAIVVDGNSRYLGVFENFNDAVIARKKAERENGFSVLHGSNRE